MSDAFLDYIEDILDAMTKAQQFVQDIDFEAFVADDARISRLSERWK